MTSGLTRLRTLPRHLLSRILQADGPLRKGGRGLSAPVESQGSDRACRGSAGIYFNKLRVPQVDASLRISALLFEYPSAILCGESVLHAAGWITQIPARLSVSVLSRPSYVPFVDSRFTGVTFVV